MTLKPETITQIQTLLQADPALLAQVQSCTDPAGAAELIVKAAADKGIDVSAADAATFLEAGAVQDGAISDAELAQIAGGYTKEESNGRWNWGTTTGEKVYNPKGKYID